MPPASVTLAVPELLWPEPEDRTTLSCVDCPALNTLLARSRIERHPPQPHEALLAALFGRADCTAYAAFRREGEAGHEIDPENACWLAADPVHLRFDQDRLILADGATLNIAREEAHALVDDLNRHFADVGEFDCAAPHRWYLRLADSSSLPAFDAPPLSAVAGRNVARVLPDVMQERVVRKLYNDVQTFLHAHPVNQRREAKGSIPVNSLWFWGRGKRPDRVETCFSGVWANDPLAVGLARAAGVNARALPADAATLLSCLSDGGQHLVVIDDLPGTVNYENGRDYGSALGQLDSAWFAPLRRALSTGHVKELYLYATTAYGVLVSKCNRLGQWCFWKRGQPLADFIRTLAKESQ